MERSAARLPEHASVRSPGHRCRERPINAEMTGIWVFSNAQTLAIDWRMLSWVRCARQRPSENLDGERYVMLILLIIVLVLLLGGGGGYYYGRGAGWGTPHYGGGLLGLVLIVLLILWLTGHMGGGMMIR